MKSQMLRAASLFAILFSASLLLSELVAAQPSHFLLDYMQQGRGQKSFFLSDESKIKSTQKTEQRVEQQKKPGPIVVGKSTDRQVIAQADTKQPDDGRMRKLEKQLQELQEEIKDLKGQPRVSKPGKDVVLEGEEGYVNEDETGVDPRGFGNRFMPYYRQTNLKSELKVDELTLFGMFAFNPRFAMTYEWAVAKKVDYSSVNAYKRWKQSGRRGGGELPHIGPLPGMGGGLPFADLNDDGDETGMGDLNLRFFVMPEQLQWMFGEDKSKNFSLMPLVEFTVPTATEDLLGDEALIASPGFCVVTDLPFDEPPFSLAMVALMNFYDFDAFKDSSRHHTSRFRGRWFYMQPLSKPAESGWSIFDLKGLYVMTEMQPVYDFNTSDFSFWISPEFGKILSPGNIFYVKPGFGVDQEKQDRQQTLEIGYRHFF